MSNLLNELSVTMKEISKLNSRLAELESKESDLSSRILLNKEATMALLETGVIVGAELLRYHSVSQCFSLSDAPVYAHDINFDEHENESKNPFKAGDWVCMFNDETIASKVSYVEGDKIETENEMWSGHYKCFTKVDFSEAEKITVNPFKVGHEVVFIHDMEGCKYVVSHVVGSTIKVVGRTTVYEHSFFGFPDEKSKNTIANILKVGDKVTHESFGEEEFKVTHIVDGLVTVDDGVIEAPFNKFSLVKE